jgi:hypothetical protein
MDNSRWITVNPVIFQGRGYSPKKDTIFVIMPFRPRWSKDVWKTIKDAISSSKIKCIRADEQRGMQILEDIWQGLCEASIVIVDVTGRNANVYYELGIAHVLGRRVILITQDVADIPFDTHVYRHIEYKCGSHPKNRKQAMRKLSKQLKEQVQWVLENESLPGPGSIAESYFASVEKYDK